MRTRTLYADDPTTLMTLDLARTFMPHPSSASQARAVACHWAEGCEPEVVASLELVVSELVTNALRHGEGEVTMTLGRTAEGIEVRVHDHGVDLPAQKQVNPRAPGGRGLHLVERLSDTWGTAVSEEGSGKVVWAVIGVPDGNVRQAARGRSVRP